MYRQDKGGKVDIPLHYKKINYTALELSIEASTFGALFYTVISVNILAGSTLKLDHKIKCKCVNFYYSAPGGEKQ